MSENSVGSAPVSGVLCQCEADLAHRGALGRPSRTQNRAGTLRLQTRWGRGEGESELKMEIPG